MIPLNKCLQQSTIQAAKLQDRNEQPCNVFNAVVSENGTLVNSGASIVYLDSKNEVGCSCCFPFSLKKVYSDHIDYLIQQPLSAF